jgi:hypothetical protein
MQDGNAVRLVVDDVEDGSISVHLENEFWLQSDVGPLGESPLAGH